MAKVVLAKSLCKHFEIDDVIVEAIKDIDLTVEEGEFIAIYGPSGAGKTTLLNLIGALDKPTSGKVIVFDHDLGAYAENFLATFRSAYIGFVFQSYNLISTLTALENIALRTSFRDSSTSSAFIPINKANGWPSFVRINSLSFSSFSLRDLVFLNLLPLDSSF